MAGVPEIKLNSGASMPAVGLGLALIGESDEQIKANLRQAIEVGYRHFDTAKLYNTERQIGEGLQEAFSSGAVKRDDIFVTTKISMNDMNPPDILPALQSSLSDLQLDYVDLLLVHWPLRFRKNANFFSLTEEDFLPLDLVGCWKVFEQAIDLGLVKSIGVSNFSPTRLKEIENGAKIIPAVNQVEMHPGCDQTKLLEYCKQKGIIVTAWSPLGAPGYSVEWWGSNAVLDSPIVKEIALKLGKSPAQVALRHTLDHGAGVIVKSSNPIRMAQNLDVFDFTLSADDHAKIKTMPQHRVFTGEMYLNTTTSPYKTLADLWD